MISVPWWHVGEAVPGGDDAGVRRPRRETGEQAGLDMAVLASADSSDRHRPPPLLLQPRVARRHRDRRPAGRLLRGRPHDGRHDAPDDLRPA